MTTGVALVLILGVLATSITFVAEQKAYAQGSSGSSGASGGTGGSGPNGATCSLASSGYRRLRRLSSRRRLLRSSLRAPCPRLWYRRRPRHWRCHLLSRQQWYRRLWRWRRALPLWRQLWHRRLWRWRGALPLWAVRAWAGTVLARAAPETKYSSIEQPHQSLDVCLQRPDIRIFLLCMIMG